MTLRTDPRRQAHEHRLRRLKGIAVGVSASMAVGFWWLVGSAVANTQSSPPATSTPQVRQDQADDNSGFFSSSQGSSLGSGAGTSRPMLRSGGS